MSTLAAAARAAGRVARALVTAAVVPAALTAQGPFTSLTVFGDSYSDTGNAFQLTGGTTPPPPYYAGRFSNGPVWVDYFAQALGRPGDAAPAFAARASSGNYAIGGARSGLLGSGGTASGVLTQVTSYLTRPVTGPVTDATGLYAIFAGGNDLRDAGALTDVAAAQALAVTAAQNVVTEAGALANAGARNVLLFTLPSPGFFPEALSIPGRSAFLDQLTTTFNTTLAAGIVGLQGNYGSTLFLNLRLDNLYANIRADALAGGAVYGITNVTVPCFGPPFSGANPPPCSSSLFFDDQHATSRGHQAIAAAAYRYVATGQNVALVPEPATVVLVGVGVVAAFGVAGRRRGRRAAA